MQFAYFLVNQKHFYTKESVFKMRSLRATIFESYWNPQFDPTYYIYLGSNQLSKYLGLNQPSLYLVRTNLVYI